MFSAKLDKLKAFDVEAEEIDKLSEFLDAAAAAGWARFAPALFARQYGVDPLRAAELLLMCAEELHLLTPNLEVECPLCSESHFTVSDPSELTGEERYCAVEEDFYVPDPELIWLTFDPTEELRRKKNSSYASSFSSAGRQPRNSPRKGRLCP